MKFVVTNYTGDRGNWGCQATSRNLLAFLKSAFSSLPGAEISLVPFPKHHRLDSMHDAIHGDRIHALYASEEPAQDELKRLEALAEERFGDFLRVARAADVIVFQGEGTVGPSEYLRNTRLYALPYLASRLWKKPVLSLNQTIYAKDRHDELAIRNIFGSFQLIAVREAASLAYARSLGLRDVVMCPDMAFLEMAPGAASVEVPRKPCFCVTGSAAGEHYDRTEFGRTIRALHEATGLEPIFLYSRAGDRQLTSEGDFSTVSGSDHPDVAEIVPLLRGASFVFGGRYHTAITALAQGTPVILLPGNTFKSEGIGPMLGIDCPVYGVGETAEIVAEAGRILSTEAVLRRSILDAVSGTKSVYDDFAAFLLALVAAEDGAEARRLRDRLNDRGAVEAILPSRFEGLYRRQNDFPIKRHAPVRRVSLFAMRRSRKWKPSIDATFTNFS